MDDQRRQWEQVFSEEPELYGKGPSAPAIKSLELFRRGGVRRILELGGGQGRDALFFAESGMAVSVLDYSSSAIGDILKKSASSGLSALMDARVHDVRMNLPYDDRAFDACYSHMLFCMALTLKELSFLSGEVLRVLRPGGWHVFTARNDSDPHFGRGIHRGEGMYENDGFAVHFLSGGDIQRLAQGFEIADIGELQEGELPRTLFHVTLRKPFRP